MMLRPRRRAVARGVAEGHVVVTIAPRPGSADSRPARLVNRREAADDNCSPRDHVPRARSFGGESAIADVRSCPTWRIHEKMSFPMLVKIPHRWCRIGGELADEIAGRRSRAARSPRY